MLNMEKLENIALIRIISIIMLTVTSMLSSGGVLVSLPSNSFMWWMTYLINYLCFASVNCFVLASSYYLTTADLTLKKVFDMIIQVFCYSVAIFAIGSYTETLKPTVSMAISAFLPFSTGCYWFASSYIALCLFSPVLNLTIKSMTREQHLALIVILLLLFSFVPSIFVFTDAWNAAKGHSLVWFVTLYIIAAYLKSYAKQTNNTP